MPPRIFRLLTLLIAFRVAAAASATEENQIESGDPEWPVRAEQPPPGFGGPRGPGGRGPMTREKIELVEKFDEDSDGRLLDPNERKAAREFLTKERAEGRLGRGFGGRGGPGGRRGPGPGRGPEQVAAPNGPVADQGAVQADGAQRFVGGSRDRPPGGAPFGRPANQPPPEAGPQVKPTDVKSYGAMPLYESQTLRTLFLEFQDTDWEKELMDFHDTDVEVPANLTVDGKTYRDIGVHFRGMSSFGMVAEGRKHSLNLSLDFVHEKQDLAGYRTLNLLNSAGDPTMLCAILYYQIAREYVPAPKANFVRVVINGESWGVYPSVQQFNKEFLQEWFGTKKGARWKAPGSPGGRAGLDVAEYKKRFEIKSKDDPAAWKALIGLCRGLNQTPADQLEDKLAPILDIDGALKFLALENVFINTDGYWVRSSDYNLYRDETGCFHVIPHDVNETSATR